jgi:hypothetical protein
MAICPLFKAECKKEKCKWWYANNEKYEDCSIVLLLEEILRTSDNNRVKIGTLQSVLLDPDNPRNEPAKKTLNDIYEKAKKEEKQQ